MATWPGTWGSECSQDERAQALAAAGVLAYQRLADAGVSGHQELAPADLRLGDDPVTWQWPDLSKLDDPRALAKAWRDARGDRTVRLRIRTMWWPARRPSGAQARGAELEVQQLLGLWPVVGDGAASIDYVSPHPRPLWRWPLDVGVPPGPAGDALADRLEQSHFHGGLARVRRLGRPHWRTSVLVLPGSLTEAAALTLTLHASVRAPIVVVLGRRASTLDRCVASIQLILDITHAHAIAIEQAETAWTAFLDALVAQLANDAPLDLALARASRNPRQRKSILVASSAILADLRLPRAPGAVARRVTRFDGIAQELFGDDQLVGLPFDAVGPGLETVGRGGDAIGRELGDEALESAPVRSARNGGGRTAAAKNGDATEDRAASAPPRWMQAQLEDNHAGPVEVAQRARDYTVLLKVGPRDARFHALAQPVAHLPVSDRDEQLMVVLTDPVLAPEPLVEWITLPPAGDSTVAKFAIRTTDTCERIEARILLFHDGRLLQTGVLRAECDGKSPVRFELDAVARTQLAGFDDRQHFGASLIANHTTDGSGFLAADASGKAARLALGDKDIEKMIEALGFGFDAIKDDPREHRSLRDDASIAALRKLARHGAMFHQSLVEGNAIAPVLLGSDPIQIVTARKNAFFPLELAYRYPTPARDAALCEHAEAALERGQCDAACGGTTERLCPLGFWSLSRVIERCSFHPSDAGMQGNFGLSVEPVRARAKLVKPARATLAASDKAKRRVPTAITDLASALGTTFGGAAIPAAPDWTVWTTQLQNDPWPALLVLVPHHDREEGEEFLEIGAAERLYSPDLKPSHVFGDREADATPRPIVLLAGCETALAAISYESFVSQFRIGGAAVVLGTIATVLGLDAAPVAGELAAELLGSFGHQPPRTIGEAMLAVRRRLVARGRVMVLSLAAYGDADWQLA